MGKTVPLINPAGIYRRDFKPFSMSQAVGAGLRDARQQVNLETSTAQLSKSRRLGELGQEAGGDRDAYKQSLTDEGYFEEADKMDMVDIQKQAGQVRNKVSMLGLMKESTDTVSDNNTYQAFKQKLSEAGMEIEAFPESYEKGGKEAIKRLSLGIDGMIKMAMDQNKQVMDQDRLNETVRHNKEVERLKGQEIGAKQKIAKSKAATDAFKTADSNAIYKRSAEMFGGTFDQTGNLIALDPDKQKDVIRLSRTAERLYKNANGSLTHSEAVDEASKKLGLSAPVKKYNPESGRIE